MTRTVVRSTGELLITAGALLLLFVGWQLWWTDVKAGREQRAVAEQLRDRWQEVPQPVGRPADVGEPAPAEPPVPAEPDLGEAFGFVHVPRFGPDAAIPVEQGVDLAEVLNKGVLGHYPDTAMPGEVGNLALAGHRVTYGRPLHRIAELRPDDPLVVETAEAWYVYRVRQSRVVQPHQVEVVAPVPGDPAATPSERLLTLTACHPMYSDRERYIVHAVLDTWQPRQAGIPAALAAAG